MSTILERASNYGVVGEYLYSIGSFFPDSLKGYGRETFVADLVKLQSSLGTLRSKHRLLPVTVSLLALPFPLQIKMDVSDILAVGRRAAGVPFQFLRNAVNYRGSRFKSTAGDPTSYVADHLNNAKTVASWFPVKRHAAAVSKVNVSIVDLMDSMVRLGMSGILINAIILCAGDLSEDQMINALIYGYGLSRTFGESGWDIAMFYVLNPKIAKNVSVALKALGANTTKEGALLVEADTLQGRLAGPIDLLEEARYRCDSAKVEKVVIPYSDDLRPHIRAVLRSELAGKECILPDLHQWWSSRWLWCVNGSQTSVSSRSLGIDPKRNRATHSRDYRRMASEALESEPLTTWDGKTSVSKSKKLENGKERAIFACDTASYFNFSWILSAAEKEWRNERILLNPGLGGHIGVVKRIRNAQRGGGVNLMLDYDDFNSHHSTDTMKAVIDELCDIFSAPAWYRNNLVNSFDRMYIDLGDEGIQRMVGTLASGHRGTTFLNSVLNGAYIRASIGGPAYDAMISLHAGDDVYIRCNTLSDCERILYKAKEFGCRMNPSKQSIGFVGAEFLRVGVGRDAAYGYLARGVSSFTSGNWVTFDVLKPLEGLQNAINGCRTLINRSGCQSYPKLLAGALRYTRGISKRNLVKLLQGDVALEGAPVFNTDNIIRNFAVCPVTDDPPPIPDFWTRNASRDYLTSHLSEIEISAIQMAGVDALSLLVTSSYSKGLNQKLAAYAPRPRLKPVKARLARGYVSATDLLNVKQERGVLANHPVLRLFEHRLNNAQLRELVLLAGGDHTAKDIRAEAFGRDAVSKNFIGYLSYGDAATLSKRTTCGNIFVLYNIYL